MSCAMHFITSVRPYNWT